MSSRVVIVGFGPQNEPLFETRDVSSDGPGFSFPHPRPDSAVASGTDRETRPGALAKGPTGTITKPSPWRLSCPCPICGQQFEGVISGQQYGESVASEDGNQVSDPEQTFRLLHHAHKLDLWQRIHKLFNVDDDSNAPDWDDEDLRKNIMELFCDARAKLPVTSMVS